MHIPGIKPLLASVVAALAWPAGAYAVDYCTYESNWYCADGPGGHYDCHSSPPVWICHYDKLSYASILDFLLLDP